MNISSRIERMIEAPVDRINRERLRLELEGFSIMNLGQAVPDLPPPDAISKKICDFIDDRNIHRYTADPGLSELRKAVAKVLRERFGVPGVQDDEIIITVGANHAFLLVSSLLIEEKNRFCLLSPFFLNHKMAVEGCGGTIVEITPDDEFNYSMDIIERTVIKERPRAVVMVNPSNPTGKVFVREELEALLKICKRYNVWLISDEVYCDFVYTPATMISLGSLPGASEGTMTIGSFSKAFGMTGWRIGWLRAPKSVISHLLKIQDYSVICPPHISQALALIALKYAPDWSKSHLDDFAKRKKEMIALLKNSGLFKIFEGDGAFFIWLRPHFDIDAENEITGLMKRAGVCMMPGNIFGESWGSWFRISYGSQPQAQLREAAVRIIRYFKNHHRAK